jgi:hypothetical protein
MNEQNERESESEMERPQSEIFETPALRSDGVRVYERPTKSSPLIFIIVLLVLAVLAAVLFFQFIR